MVDWRTTLGVGPRGLACALLGMLLWAQIAAATPTVAVGSPLPLDTPDMSFPFSPAGNRTGPFVLPWLSADYTRLRARVFDGAGQARTPVLDLAVAPATDISAVACDMDGQGGFLIAWYVGRYTGRIEARRFNADGSPATGTLVLSDLARYRALDVALRPDGSFIVAWAVPYTPAERLVFRLFDAAGNPLGPVIPASGLAGCESVSVDVDAQGGFVLAYTVRPPFLLDAWVRLFDEQGATRSPEIHVSPVPTGDSSYFVTGVRLFPDGRFVVGYLECDPLTQPFGRAATLVTFDATGNPVASATPVPAGVFIFELFLASDRPGNLATFGDYNYYSSPTDRGAGRFRIANAGGSEVGLATVTKPQISPDPGAWEWPKGVMAFGPGAFNVVWHLGGPVIKAYVQSFTLLPEEGPPTSFYTVPPCRLVDTRVTAAPLVAREDRIFNTSRGCAIPTSAKSIAVNAVAVGPTAAGNLRFYRPDRLASGTAVVSYRAGDTRGAFTLIGLDDVGGFVARATQASGTVHVVVDVTGYFE